MKATSLLRSLTLVGALLAAGVPGIARAQDASELEKLKSAVKSLEQTVQELNRRIAEMEKQSKAAPTPAQVAQPVPSDQAAPAMPPAMRPGALSSVPAEAAKSDLAEEASPIRYQDSMSEDQLSAPRPGNAPLDPTYEGFMQLFGTKTWIKLGGYAKLDMITDTTKVGNPNEFITREIPVEGEADYDKGQQFSMQAKQTRLNFELRSPTPIGSLKIFYENDFYGNSDQPNMDYRLRHFYGQVANITIGHTWSTFYDPDANPDTLDFEGPGILPVLRQAQVRYTLPLIKDEMHLAFAAEQPKTDFDDDDFDGDGSDDARNLMPDFISHWRWAGKPGHVQLGGVVRCLSYDTGSETDSALGWGLNLAGSLKTWGEDSLMASGSFGDGLGRYVQDLSDSGAVADANGDLHTLRTYGGMVAYRHFWNEKWRSTASYSYVRLDNRAEQGDFAYDYTHYAQVNLIWAVSKNFSVGLEYLYGMKQARNGNDGDDHRVQLSLQYKLIR